jgi:steroid delta-isomerase-like uncharacterized protein
MTTTARSGELAARFFDAFGRRDVDAMMSMVSEDITENLAGIGVINGIEEDRAFLTALFESFPDLETQVTRTVAAGNIVAVEWRRRGTFTGRPWQGLPASGRPFAFRGCALVEVDGDRVKRVDVYSDTAEFARDIGVLPPEGSIGERVALAAFRMRVRAHRVIRALGPSSDDHVAR